MKDTMRRHGLPVVANDVRDPYDVGMDLDFTQKRESPSGALHRRGGLVRRGPVLHAIAINRRPDEA